MSKTPDTTWTAKDWFDFLQARVDPSVSGISDVLLQQAKWIAPHTVPKAGQYNLRLAHPTGLLELAVGTDYVGLGAHWRTYLRVPLRPDAAQRLCDAFGCVLPTAGFVDALLTTGKRLAFHTGTPGKFATVLSTNAATNADIAQIPLSAADLPVLLCGHSKDVVLTNRLSANPQKVAIYGAHGTDRRADDPLQELTTVHSWNYTDYSQRVRLLHRTCRLAGKEVPTLDAIGTLRTPEPLRFRAYPVHSTTGPVRL